MFEKLTEVETYKVIKYPLSEGFVRMLRFNLLFQEF